MKKPGLIFTLIMFASLAITLGFKSNFIDKDYWFAYITSHFEEYILKYPQQKVYLHLDRDEYETGSTIWYKAYVFDDTKKLPDNRAKILYIELISPTKQVIMNQLLKIENGTAQGDLPVRDTVGTGLYMVRAFTNNMKNFGKEYLFSREIRIVNPEKIYYSKEFRKTAKKIKKQSDEIDVQFFPEGGNLIDNIKTNIAFKAINQSGKSVEFEGKIFDKNKSLVGEIKSSHLGMGQAEFTPQKGQKYTARIKSNKKKEWMFNLPEVLEKGYVLNVKDKGDYFQVNIQTNIGFGADPVSRSAYIFVQNGGRIYYKEKLEFENQNLNIEIDKKYFPQGIAHFTLFDGYGKPQCERLAFINKDDYLKINTNWEKTVVARRDLIEFDISVNDKKGEPVSADLSLSVKNKTMQTGSNNDVLNIKNYMLLQSDLQGYIENPEYYFDNNPQHQKDIDLLMLTQGWRKFLWNNVLKDSIPSALFGIEDDIGISGRITKYFFDMSVENADVTLTLLNQFNDVFTTKSVKNGKFEFLRLNYYDTIDVLIEARTQYERKNILILLDESLPLANDFKPFKSFYVDSLMIKRKTLHAKWKEPLPDPSKPADYKIYNSADQVLNFDKPSYGTYTNVMDALKGKVPGLQVGKSSALIRGPSSFFGSNEPLYLIDGMETDYTGIQSVNVNDIDHVDILKGPSAAIFGVRGSNGVIAVYTKKGFYYTRGEIRFKMLGYHNPKVFYSPKYKTENMDWATKDLRKTVYWNPNLKTDQNGKVHVSFNQSDIIDDFEIVIEGMSRSGQPITYHYQYRVKENN